ncbi:MAG: hypothetical protein RL153_745 [Verrucomicrobiota bacterium]
MTRDFNSRPRPSVISAGFMQRPNRFPGRCDFSVLVPEPFGPANLGILGIVALTGG